MRTAIAAFILVASVPAHAVATGPSTLGPKASGFADLGPAGIASNLRENLNGPNTAPLLIQPRTALQPEFDPNSVGGGPRPPGAVPEPGTWLTFILGFGALGMVMRRRRTVAA